MARNSHGEPGTFFEADEKNACVSGGRLSVSAGPRAVDRSSVRTELTNTIVHFYTICRMSLAGGDRIVLHRR
jgi:hypothetical protein